MREITVWVVYGDDHDYDYMSQWLVGVYATEEEAAAAAEADGARYVREVGSMDRPSYDILAAKLNLTNRSPTAGKKRIPQFSGTKSSVPVPQSHTPPPAKEHLTRIEASKVEQEPECDGCDGERCVYVGSLCNPTPAPASDELLEALEAEIERLRPYYQGRGLDQARVQMLDHFADFIAKHKG